MPKERKTDQYRRQLCDCLRPYLPGEWELEGAPDWRFLQRHDWGYVGVGPSMSFKHLPSTSVFLTFGVKHHILEPTLRHLDEAAGHKPLETYQVSQTTENYALSSGWRSVLVDDYNQPPYVDLFQPLIGGEGGRHLLGLFDRFSSLHEIRESLEKRDGALMITGAPNTIIAIDLALDDLAHLKNYRDTCTPRHFAHMIDRSLAVLDVAL
ncbi:MAG: hypothetical protein K0Q55_1963 [Verrucomicrobia bacterium]|jgi:hypothetical protein|nr:hypothetical protein [Verrucomicrobiota bacterium]